VAVSVAVCSSLSIRPRRSVTGDEAIGYRLLYASSVLKIVQMDNQHRYCSLPEPYSRHTGRQPAGTWSPLSASVVSLIDWITAMSGARRDRLRAVRRRTLYHPERGTCGRPRCWRRRVVPPQGTELADEETLVRPLSSRLQRACGGFAASQPLRFGANRPGPAPVTASPVTDEVHGRLPRRRLTSGLGPVSLSVSALRDVSQRLRSR
jgi:hypothetical protein